MPLSQKQRYSFLLFVNGSFTTPPIYCHFCPLWMAILPYISNPYSVMRVFCVWEFSRSPPNSFHFYYVSMTVLPHTSVIRAIIKCQFRNIIPTQILSTQNWISPIPSICALCALYFHHTKSNFLKVYFWIIVLQGSHSILSFPYFLSPTLKSCIVYTVKWGGTLSSSFSKISFNSLFC